MSLFVKHVYHLKKKTDNRGQRQLKLHHLEVPHRPLEHSASTRVRWSASFEKARKLYGIINSTPSAS